jgi:dTDP-4-dehydrorhamnose 3,5-epimerase
MVLSDFFFSKIRSIKSNLSDLCGDKINNVRMKIVETELGGVLVIEPDVFNDARGYFFETYHQNRYQEIGIKSNFVQDNLSSSKKGTLRGLHYQHPHGQVKLVQVIQGDVFDVVVDIRREAPTFGKWIGQYLSKDVKANIQGLI